MTDERDILSLAAAATRNRKRTAMVTVIECAGSTPRKPGARMLVYENGEIAGSIGGGVVEHKIIEFSQKVISQGYAEIITYKLTAELAMCCGGQMKFFVEPMMIKPNLLVMGCGHVGKALIECAAPLGFEIYAIDDLSENIQSERLPQAQHTLNSYDRSSLAELPFDEDTYVVIATREHRIDQELLEFCLQKEYAFLGCIGSERKATMQRQRLSAKGFEQTRIEQIACPVGVDIAAQTPEEIAVSICAQMIKSRNSSAET